MTGREGIAAIGLLAAIVFTLQCHPSRQQAGTKVEAAPAEPMAVVASASPMRPASALELMARSEPLRFAAHCLEHCRAQVRDYRCTFTKQEVINGKLGEPQIADVRFRSEPFSVDMTFTGNVRSCARALYVAGRWKDPEEGEMALVKPGGAILRALVPQIKHPIHGPRATKESRRSLDQFGFERSLDLVVKYSQQAQRDGELSLRYLGEGRIDRRPTFVFERRLPYTGQEVPYPDRVLIYHIDQYYLVPTACFSYADDAATDLLGSYVYTDIQMNPGYDDDDFDPVKISF